MKNYMNGVQNSGVQPMQPDQVVQPVQPVQTNQVIEPVQSSMNNDINQGNDNSSISL